MKKDVRLRAADALESVIFIFPAEANVEGLIAELRKEEGVQTKTPLPAEKPEFASPKVAVVKPEFDGPLIRRSHVIKLLAGEGMLKRCEKAGWLKARVRRRKYVVYRRDDVLACIARIDAGEYP